MCSFANWPIIPFVSLKEALKKIMAGNLNRGTVFQTFIGSIGIQIGYIELLENGAIDISKKDA
jgi:hypothetical protein